MFTGLVECQGRVESVRKVGADLDLGVDVAALDRVPAIGDSIALSGVCCTVTELDASLATFRLSAETLRRTWLGQASAGTRLNLEDALRAGDPLGGHLVQGHVDAVGSVAVPVGPAGGEWWIDVPEDVARYCVLKGSLAVDGVSLTLAEVDGRRLMIAVIPHTAEVTTIGAKPEGAPLNLEVDILAKYVEKLVVR